MASYPTQRLAELVAQKAIDLQQRNPKLSPREAFLQAVDEVIKAGPDLLSAWRANVRTI